MSDDVNLKMILKDYQDTQRRLNLHEDALKTAISGLKAIADSRDSCDIAKKTLKEIKDVFK